MLTLPGRTALLETAFFIRSPVSQFHPTTATVWQQSRCVLTGNGHDPEPVSSTFLPDPAHHHPVQTSSHHSNVSFAHPVTWQHPVHISGPQHFVSKHLSLIPPGKLRYDVNTTTNAAPRDAVHTHLTQAFFTFRLSHSSTVHSVTSFPRSSTVCRPAVWAEIN